MQIYALLKSSRTLVALLAPLVASTLIACGGPLEERIPHPPDCEGVLPATAPGTKLDRPIDDLNREPPDPDPDCANRAPNHEAR